jgi:hypothetical protein
VLNSRITAGSTGLSIRIRSRLTPAASRSADARPNPASASSTTSMVWLGAMIPSHPLAGADLDRIETVRRAVAQGVHHALLDDLPLVFEDTRHGLAGASVPADRVAAGAEHRHGTDPVGVGQHGGGGVRDGGDSLAVMP